MNASQIHSKHVRMACVVIEPKYFHKVDKLITCHFEVKPCSCSRMHIFNWIHWNRPTEPIYPHNLNPSRHITSTWKVASLVHWTTFNTSHLMLLFFHSQLRPTCVNLFSFSLMFIEYSDLINMLPVSVDNIVHLNRLWWEVLALVSSLLIFFLLHIRLCAVVRLISNVHRNACGVQRCNV